MRKYKSADIAKQYAYEMDLAMGMSIFDGFYYVGGTAQVQRIGCVNIETPRDPTFTIPEPN